MSTLMIKDLSVTTELDHAEMAAVRGGTYKGYNASMSLCSPDVKMPDLTRPASTFSVDASQMIGQEQNVTNNNGNCVAFANCITSTVNPTQSGNNSINF